MKAKVLCTWYYDNSAFVVVRVYLEKDFDQAKKDLDMLVKFASDSRHFELQDVEIFEPKPL